MKTKNLGRTGYKISVMGYGCGGYWGKTYFDEKKAISLVRQAIDNGVNFFDTGAGYCEGNAEIRLGKALQGVDVSKLIIGTKVGTCVQGKKIYKDYSSKTMIAQVEASLKKLKLDHIPLLQLHSMPVQGFEETLNTLVKLKAQGKVSMIGVSSDGAALEHALSSNLLDVVMLKYNLIQKKSLKQIELAYEKGCGVLIKSPMCHTLYSNELLKIRRLSDVWYLLRALKNHRHLILESRKYHFINHIKDWSAHEIALLYALHEKVSCVVTGTTNSENMQRNIIAVSKMLPQSLREQIDAIV